MADVPPTNVLRDEAAFSEAVASPIGSDGNQGNLGKATATTGMVDLDGDVSGFMGCFSTAKKAAVKVVHRVIPPGGLMASAFSLASGTIGAGILGLPAGTDTSGLALASIYLFVITVATVFSMHILSLTTLKTNIRTIEGLGRYLFPWGNFAFSYWVAFVRWFYSFGACVGYVISIGDCFKTIINGAYKNSPENSTLKFLSTTTGIRLLQSMLWLCIMLPLVIPKHIDSLRYASTFAVTMMTYFCIVIIIHSCLNGLPVHKNNIRVSGRRNSGDEGDYIYLFRTGNDAITALGVFVFAYVCQINALEVLFDMPKEIRTPRNFTYSVVIGMTICTVLYLLVSVFGYFDFGARRLANNSILLMYTPTEEPYMMVAYIGVMCKLCVSYALLGLSARNSVYYVIGWQQKYQKPKHLRKAALVEAAADTQEMQTGFATADSDSGDNNAADAMSSSVDKDEGDDSVFVDNIPFWRHLVAVVILSVAALLCGLFIPNIKIVFGFAGAISGGFLAFIFPSIFYMYAGDFTRQKVGNILYFGTYALLIMGVVGVVFGTSATVYTTFGGK